MTIRNTKLGGSDWTSEQLASLDLNDTIDAVIDSPSIGESQNAYQSLQANDIFENKDNLCADEFVTSTGTNATVNTTSSTGYFYSTTPSYTLNFTDEASGDTTHNPSSFTNPGNAFDNNDSTSATKNHVSTVVSDALGKTFASARYISYVKIISSQSDNGSTGRDIYLQTYDGATWTTVATLAHQVSSLSISYSGTYYLNTTTQGIRILNTTTFTSGSTHVTSVTTLEYGDYNSSDTVIADSGTLTLDGTETGIGVYCDSTFPTNTSMTVTAGDGTLSTSAQSINSSNKSSGVFDITSLGTGTLNLTFTLSTIDTSVTPTFRGYGVKLIR